MHYFQSISIYRASASGRAYYTTPNPTLAQIGCTPQQSKHECIFHSSVLHSALSTLSALDHEYIHAFIRSILMLYVNEVDIANDEH